MATTIQLDIQVNKAKASADIQAVETAAKKIEKNPVTINFKAEGTKVVVNEAKAVATAYNEAITALARMQQQQARSADTATNLANAQAKLATAENKTAVEEQRTAQTANKLATEQERTAQTANRLAIEQERTARASLNAGTAANTAAGGFSVLGGAMATALGHLASKAIQLALRKITQGLREALTEMKNVDTQLANIQKVTGESDAAIAKLGDTAYDTASKYGVAANEYLTASADFAKAGYDNYADMAELATKTQLVGDVSADVASKFLLSADAAFKFGGDITQLSTVLDKANTIENNYATSIEKLADGFPIVANTAAMANMSIDETMAAIGTITAVTQESGPMAARALRALILNILQDTTTEVEDGVTVTKDQIRSLRDALKQYAPDVVAAAEATGKIIDPMEAIGALSKAWEDGLLTEQKLASIVTDIGGKLRTNQLLALIKNFGMFNEMLGKSKESAGSADKEIGVMLGTWEAKSNILKNTWTKLISDIVDTDTIKGGLDWLTDLIDKADGFVDKVKSGKWYDSEQTAKAYQDAAEELASLESRESELNGVEKKRLEILREITQELKNQSEQEAKNAAEKVKNELLQNTYTHYDSEGFYQKGSHKESGDTARLNELYGAYREAESEYANSGDLDAFQQKLQEIVGTYGDYAAQLQKIKDAGVDLTDNQQKFLEQYSGIESASTSVITDIQDIGDGLEGLYDTEGNLVAIVQSRTALRDEEAERAAEAQAEQEEAIASFEEQVQSFDATYAAAAEAQQRELEELQKEWGNATTGTDNLTDAEGAAASAGDDVTDAVGGIAPGLDNATAAVGKLIAALKTAAGVADSITVGGVDAEATGTRNAPGGPTLVNELGPELISENGHAYIANGGRPGIVNLSRGAIVLTAEETADAMNRRRAGGTKKINAAAAGKKRNVAGGFLGGNVPGTSSGNSNTSAVTDGTTTTQGEINRKKGPIDKNWMGPAPEWWNGAFADDKQVIATGTDKKSNKKSGGVAAAAPVKTVEDYAKETKDILSNIEKQAKLADNRGQYTKEENLWAKGQSEIDKMIARYKKAGYKETDDEILDLLNKRYDYEKKKEAASKKTIENAAKDLSDKLSVLDKQAKLAASEGDYTKEVEFYEKAQEEIKKMVEKYRKAGYKDDSKEILDLLQKNVDYGEKQVKVYQDRWKDLIDALEADTEAQEVANRLAEKEQALAEAQEALDNATKQRTVRTYNAATGQWEWVADQSKVKSAQEALTKAEKDYSDEIKDQAINELERLSKTVTDLNDVVLGPALSKILLQAENSEEFQNFARALNAVYGVGSYLSSTEGSSKVLSTADSHDTIYTFGNVTLTEEEASSMSVADLAKKLQVLKIS